MKRIRKHRVSTLDRTEMKLLPLGEGESPHCLSFVEVVRGGYGIGIAHRFASVSRLAIRSSRRKAREVN